MALVTDGLPECGAPDVLGGPDGHRAAIRRANVKPTPVSVFGVGLTTETRTWCQLVAAENGGAFVDVR